MNELKYLQEVEEALVPVVEWLRTAAEGERYQTRRVKRYRDGQETATVARLRLDFELADETLEEFDSPELATAHILPDLIATDLADLVENGDVNHTSDPLISTIDGATKRGVEPQHIEITSFMLIVERKEAKASTEFTVFCLMLVEWEGQQ